MDAPPRRRLGCIGWLLVAGCLLLVAVAILLLWRRSTGDLDAEAARARALGVAMAGDLPPEEPPGLRSWLAELERVTGRATRYEGPHLDTHGDPWQAAPPELLAWTSGVDADVDALLDRAPQGRLRLPTGATSSARNDYAGYGVYEAKDLLLQRLFRTDAPRPDLDRLQLLSGVPHGFMGLWSWYKAEDAWLYAALRHRERLDPATTAASARSLATAMHERVGSAIASQPAIWDDLLRQPVEPLLRDLNIRLPSLMVMDLDSGLLLIPRAGRRRILARSVDAAAWVRTHGTPATFADIAAMSPRLDRLRPSNAWHELYSSILDEGFCAHCRGYRTSACHAQAEAALRIITHLRVFAADLDGSPWPPDPGDPSGAPLRPIVRDGVVIGAYSVGVDGVDDGGDRRTDLCLPLRARLGYPRASDPPPAP
jgi:hypothetical protein